MLPGGTDLAYRALLAGPYHPTTRIEVWRQGVRIDPFGNEGLPFFDGNITATLVSQVTRQLSLNTDGSMYPRIPTDLLAPYGNELRVFQGIKPGAGVPYEWPTFRGRINEVELDTDGSMSLGALDRAADINDAGFSVPENSTVGATISLEFARIVTEGVPDATFGTFDVLISTTPQLTWEEDRGAACDDLASAASAYWYALSDGSYVLRRVPWAIPQIPVIELSDGPGGTLSTAIPRRSRENVFNVVTVVGERADGTPPVFATVSDSDVTSPTYTGGAFGVKSKLVRAQGASTSSQALTLARTSLLQARSLTQAWNVSTTADPALELGDAVTINARDLPPEVQVVSSFTLPLTGASPMGITFRALQPGLVE